MNMWNMSQNHYMSPSLIYNLDLYYRYVYIFYDIFLFICTVGMN